MQTKDLRLLNFGILLCLSLSACGGGPPAPETVTENDKAESTTVDGPIEDIRQRFSTVNEWLNQAQLRMDSLPYDCVDYPSGGTIKLFRHEGELVMLRHDFYQGDHDGTTETYYLENEHPVFVFVEETSWRFAGPDTDDPAAPNTEDRIT